MQNVAGYSCDEEVGMVSSARLAMGNAENNNLTIKRVNCLHCGLLPLPSMDVIKRQESNWDTTWQKSKLCRVFSGKESCSSSRSSQQELVEQ